jgi:prevent-host-death family protein
MTEVGVRELKARLSEHLRRAEAGEQLIVTDRGKAIATIGPIEKAARAPWLAQLVAEGTVRYDGGKPLGLMRRVRLKGGATVSAAIVEDRR